MALYCIHANLTHNKDQSKRPSTKVDVTYLLSNPIYESRCEVQVGMGYVAVFSNILLIEHAAKAVVI